MELVARVCKLCSWIGTSDSLI